MQHQASQLKFKWQKSRSTTKGSKIKKKENILPSKKRGDQKLDDFIKSMLDKVEIDAVWNILPGMQEVFIGLIDKNYQGEEMCFILPGTHSKHILLNDGLIIDFKTYMTGEIFEMLIKHSTLSEALEKVNEMDPSLFEQGVLRSVEGSSLLHEWFKVRTSHLLKKRSRIENHSYLSGLLIGEELRYLKTYPGKIRLAAGSSLYQQYALALKVLQLSNVEFVSKEEESLSVVRGQWKVLNLVYGS